MQSSVVAMAVGCVQVQRGCENGGGLWGQMALFLKSLGTTLFVIQQTK